MNILDKPIHTYYQLTLQQMILNDIPDNAILIKVPAPPIGTKRLFKREHNALHMVPIPHILHPNISKSHHHEVLHHFLSEVVIDTEEIGLVKVLTQSVEDIFAALQVSAERLFDDHATESIWCHAGLFDCFSSLSKDIGGTAPREDKNNDVDVDVSDLEV